MFRFLTLISLVSLTGCLGMPSSVTPINNFDPNNYTGQWYELARLDHSFERGLSHVSAEYSFRQDGGIKVLNKGYSKQKGQWQQAEGKAYLVEDSTTGYLKVSFFGPFYGSYVIFHLDPDGQYAFVSGPDHSYLWLMSRTPILTDEVKKEFVDQANKKGFDTKQLIFVDQKPTER
ncbi:lipocalin family protein [Vibrio algicola]|uniref:Outer membrane lipoprotein Blc n=1 Tax=Vibrio algicola TaxID=2662262 RepID=A0A5Q0TFW9_9VIBR|nr:lipocalin family protein [Vibrio algicola]